VKIIAIFFLIITQFFSCTVTQKASRVQPSSEEHLFNSQVERDEPEIPKSENETANLFPKAKKEPDLPEKNEQPKVSEKIPEERPNPLSASQIEKQIKDFSGYGYWPVHNNNHIIFLSTDLDRNGLDDVIVLYVSADHFSEADADLLSDFSRLYDITSKPFDCYLQVFFQFEGRITPVYRIPLGKKVVFDSLKQVEIKKDSDRPFAVSASFQFLDGSERDWVIFGEGGISRFTMKESFSVKPEIRDIDGDNYIDIVIHQRSFEEGTGYETFLTWYKWDGSNFKEYKNTNIVRNLKNFLSFIRKYIQSHNWEKLLEHSLPSETLKELYSKGLEPGEICTRIFQPSTASEEERLQYSEAPPLIELNVKEVLFPEILENPFVRTEKGDYLFPLSVRITAKEGIFVYNAKIKIPMNPFVSRQYQFVVE